MYFVHAILLMVILLSKDVTGDLYAARSPDTVGTGSGARKPKSKAAWNMQRRAFCQRHCCII